MRAAARARRMRAGVAHGVQSRRGLGKPVPGRGEAMQRGGARACVVLEDTLPVDPHGDALGRQLELGDERVGRRLAQAIEQLGVLAPKPRRVDECEVALDWRSHVQALRKVAGAVDAVGDAWVDGRP